MTERTALPDPVIAAPAADTGQPEGTLRDWFVLLKPRVVTLVVFTGVVGLLVAPGHLHPVLASPRCCASPSPPAPRAPSTCGTTATSTR